MKLYLVQHGEASPEETDPERPLSDKGRSDTSKAAAFLREAGISVETILHSTKLRAEQTARILADTLDQRCDVVKRDFLSPNDPLDNILDEISRRDDDLMIVGHLPFLDRLTSRLILGSEEKSIVRFRQGGVLFLERGEERSWRITGFIVPDLLQK